MQIVRGHYQYSSRSAVGPRAGCDTRQHTCTVLCTRQGKRQRTSRGGLRVPGTSTAACMHLMLYRYECMNWQGLSAAASWARSAMQQGLDEHSDTFKVPSGAIFAILTPFNHGTEDLQVDEEALVRYLKVQCCAQATWSVICTGSIKYGLPVCPQYRLHHLIPCCVACSISGLVEPATSWSMGELQLVPVWLHMQPSNQCKPWTPGCWAIDCIYEACCETRLVGKGRHRVVQSLHVAAQYICMSHRDDVCILPPCFLQMLAAQQESLTPRCPTETDQTPTCCHLGA